MAHVTPRGGNAARWTLIAAVLGSSMAFIDGTVVNVALPALQRDLRTDAAGAQWVVEAYALFASALLLVGGAAGDRLGRRRVFVCGVGLFGVASLLCGLAPSIGVLVAARALQGVGGALLIPGSLALISATFAANERGRAIGTWSGATSITTAAGPLLGGFLVDHLSWRWAFLINPPIAVVVMLIAVRRTPESRDDTLRGHLDLPGAALVTLGLGAVVLALIDADTAGITSARVVLVGAAGIALLAAFLAVEARTGEPMLPLGLFRSRAFATTNLLTLFLYAALGAELFVLPLVLIEVHRYSPLQAGAALLPFVVLLSLLSRRTGALSDRIGPRGPLIAGPLLTAAGFVVLARPGTGGDYVTTILPAVLLLGLGMALVVAPLTTTVMTSVEPRRVGAASGVNNAVSRAGGLLAVAVAGLVLTAGFGRALDSRLAGLHLDAAQTAALDAERPRLALAEPPRGSDATAVERATAESMVEGFRAVCLLTAGLAGVSAAVAAAGLRTPRAAAPPTSRPAAGSA